MGLLTTFDGTPDPAARMAIFFGALSSDWWALFAELRDCQPVLDL